MKDDYYNGALGDNIDGFNEELFERALDRWTERPLLGEGYNKRLLNLYDSLIWTRVENAKIKLKILKDTAKACEKITINGEKSRISTLFGPTLDDKLRLQTEVDNYKKIIEYWKYVGNVYRVIDCKKDEVEYHHLIASWVSNPKSFDNFNKINRKHRYTFLIGKTGRDWAFDVNKYRKYINNRHQYTEHESEIILPMDEEYVTDMFYGTLEEFYKYIRTKE